MDGRTPIVLLVMDDVSSTDQLCESLTAFGLTVTTAFSTGEAMRAAIEDPPDVALIDADIEGAADLRPWIQRKYAATVCYLHEFDRSRTPTVTDGEPKDDDIVMADDSDSDDLVSMLLSALANVRAARMRAGHA